MRFSFLILYIWCVGCATTPQVREAAVTEQALPVGVQPATSNPMDTIASNECRHSDESFHCVEFVKNYDADTVTFNVKGVPKLFGGNIPVRLRGIDTPELRTKNICEKKAAVVARDFVNKALVGAKRIDLINVDRDKYFRILADVVVDGGSLSELLLAQGYAYPYHGGTKQKIDWCKTIPAH